MEVDHPKREGPLQRCIQVPGWPHTWSVGRSCWSTCTHGGRPHLGTHTPQGQGPGWHQVSILTRSGA